MTTQAWSSRIRHDSDAVFREWGSEFSAKLAAVGLIQTADTGQIDWATVLRPATNVIAGFQIWRFNDPLQATAPVFLKVSFGTNVGGATMPALAIQVGIATNGAGILSGVVTSHSTGYTHGSNPGAQTNDNVFPSLMCGAPGFFGFSFKSGSGVQGYFSVCRTCDLSGAPTIKGVHVSWGVGTAGLTTTQVLRFQATAAAQTVRAATALGFNPGGRTVTLLNGSLQGLVGLMVTPEVEPIFGLAGALITEVPAGTQYTFAPVGATPRNYVALPANVGSFENSSYIGMLWE